MKFYLITLFLLSNILTNAQTRIVKQKDHIFKEKLEGKSYQNDDNRYLKKFTIGIKWSVFLGEPVESYTFKWEANNSFRVKINGAYRTFTRNEINKYPELIKRLDDVRPYKIDVLISGNAKGEINSLYGDYDINGIGRAPNLSVKDNSSISAGFYYIIKDENLIFGKSGKETSGAIVGTSPDWNNFIKWKSAPSYTPLDPAGIGRDLKVGFYANYSEKDYKNLSIENKNKINKQIKQTYLSLKSMEVYATLDKIDWLLQLESIAKDYLKKEEKVKKSDSFWDDDDDDDDKKKDKITDSFWAEEKATKETNDFWESDRLKVEVQKPINNSTSSKNVVDFEAKYNVFSDAFKGYLEYNGINQRVIPVNGKFRGKLVLKSGINYVTFKIKSSDNTIFEKKFNVNYSGKPVKLRATLTWNGYADIDLYLKDVKGNTCSYSNKNTTLAVLDVDNTRAYGPENISVEKIISGEYEVYIKNYSKKSGIRATVYIFLDEKLYSTKSHTFDGYSNTKSISTLKL